MTDAPLTPEELAAWKGRTLALFTNAEVHRALATIADRDKRIAELQAERTFPVQRFGSIPWKIGERAWNAYAAKYGRLQSCERIAERGGFGVQEMDVFYPEWRAEVSFAKRAEAAEAKVAELEAALLDTRRERDSWHTAFQDADAALAILDFEGEDDVGWNLDGAMKSDGRRSRNMLERVRDQLARARAALKS